MAHFKECQTIEWSKKTDQETDVQNIPQKKIEQNVIRKKVTGGGGVNHVLWNGRQYLIYY